MHLIAQAVTEVSIKDLLSIGGPFGIAAVLVWYLYYQTSVAAPRIAAEHRAEREKASDTFTTTLDRIVDRFQGELAAEREHREREAKEVRERFQCINRSQ